MHDDIPRVLVTAGGLRQRRGVGCTARRRLGRRVALIDLAGGEQHAENEKHGRGQDHHQYAAVIGDHLSFEKGQVLAEQQAGLRKQRPGADQFADQPDDGERQREAESHAEPVERRGDDAVARGEGLGAAEYRTS